MTDDRNPAAEIPLRERLILALDVEDLATALLLARSVREYFALVKVGLELYSSEGPDAVRALNDEGFAVFVDLKLHDIPTTVERAARALGRLGVRLVTFHAAGGLAMARAGVRGLAEGANEVGALTPTALGVTVLTSEEAPEDLLEARVRLVKEAGAGGLVCAAPDLPLISSVAPGLLTVVPGTRPPWAKTDDQLRTATPGEALALGADLLVVGRPVTRAPDPVSAAAALFS